MSWFSRVTGRATPLGPEVARERYRPLFVGDERVDVAFELIRDVVVLTDRRYLEIDVTGLTGQAVRYFSVPYTRIEAFSIESAGPLDLDASLCLWIQAVPPLTRAAAQAGCSLVRRFSTGVDIYLVARILARRTCQPMADFRVEGLPST